MQSAGADTNSADYKCAVVSVACCGGGDVLFILSLSFQSKIVMYSEYERQKDKRSYGERHELYHGPQYLFPAEKIKPQKVLKWSEEGLPIYEEIPGMEGAQEQAAEEE